MTEANPNRPSHTIFQVIGEGEKARWLPIGAAWTNRDGKGLTCSFDALPVTGRTVIREAKASDEAQEKGGQS